MESNYGSFKEYDLLLENEIPSHPNEGNAFQAPMENNEPGSYFIEDEGVFQQSVGSLSVLTRTLFCSR